jgi:hypothetical protein
MLFERLMIVDCGLEASAAKPHMEAIVLYGKTLHPGTVRS